MLADYNQYLSAMRDEDGTPLYGIVMECGKQIIGVAIMRAEMVGSNYQYCQIFVTVLYYQIFVTVLYCQLFVTVLYCQLFVTRLSSDIPI